MKHIIIAPDSFKGTLSAQDICEIEKKVVLRHLPDAVVHTIPMSDGGEGMVASYLRFLGGREVRLCVTGPMGQPVEAVYGILPDGSAVMEMAAAAGLPLVEGEKNPLQATTYGVGEMLLHAQSQGVRKILLGLGGSATNDCGIGMAAALGFSFLDQEGRPVEPLAGNMGRIHQILPPKTPLSFTVTAACDVNNPLTGPNGATYIFGPQKGATPEKLGILEEGACHMAALFRQQLGADVEQAPGAGAAGGMGAAVLAFLKGTLRPGIDLLLDAAGFDTLLQDADLVLTGEGRIDHQSVRGKVPMGVGIRCKARGVPCVALCGSIGSGAEAVYDCGITAIFSAVKGPTTMEAIAQTCHQDLADLTDAVLRLLLSHSDRR